MSAQKATSVAAAMSGLILLVAARGQYPANQQGNALDANNYVGGTGNLPYRRDYFPSANLYVTGNVSGGGGFRGFQTIRDSSQLLIDVPSAQLGGFQRNAIGVSDVLNGRSLFQPTPFYLPQQTAGFATGYNAFATPGLETSSNVAFYRPPQLPVRGLDGRLTPPILLSPGAYRSTTGLDRLDDPRLSPGAAIPSLRSSSPYRFGDVPPTFGQRLDGRGLLPSSEERPGVFAPPIFDASALPSRASVIQAPEFGPDFRVDDVLSRTRSLTDPRQLSSGARRGIGRFELDPATGRIVRREFDEPPGPVPGAARGLTARRADDSREGAARSPLEPGDLLPGRAQPETARPEGDVLFRPTGNDVLSDVQAAFKWLEAARKRRSRAAQPAEPSGPLDVPSALDADSLVSATRVLSEPMESYAGRAETRSNQYIREAEALARRGEYYRAAQAYETAGYFDRDNPLIELGRAHALIGAGEYASAVLHLKRGLERFPDLVHLNIDLAQFISDVTVLDSRRAELETRLAESEHNDLRFLLGYIEYFGGLRKFGLENLKRAAAAAPADSIVARVPGLLSASPLEDLSAPAAP